MPNRFAGGVQKNPRVALASHHRFLSRNEDSVRPGLTPGQSPELQGEHDAETNPRSPNGYHDLALGSVRRTLLILALPVLAEQLLNAFIALFDTWLAGRIHAAATAGVGLAAYVSWLASMIVMLVGTGTTALVARSVGGGDTREANRIMNQSMVLAVFLGLCVSVILFSLAPALARYSNMTGQAYALTVRYLRIDAFGHMFMAVTLVGCASLRGAGDMRRPLGIFLALNSINVVASSVLFFVFHLGVDGIVAGTVTARVVGSILTVLVLMRGRSGLKLNKNDCKIDKPRTLRILRIGLPAAMDGAIMWSGHFAFLAIIARVAPGSLGQICLAAHIITVRVESLVYLPAMAWGVAAATMIGQALGAGNPARAKQAGHEAVLQCGLLCIGVAVIYYWNAERIFALMSVDVMVQAAGVGPFKTLAFLLPLLAVSIVYVGGLRGAGDTRVPMFITFGGVFLRLTLGAYCGLVLDLGLLGAWMGMFADMIWRAAAISARFFGGRWVSAPV